MRWGPERCAANRWRFALWAPDRGAVTVETKDGAALAMHPLADGWFAVEADIAPGTHYRFRFPDGLAVADPASRAQSGGVHGWSIVDDPAAFAWHCPDWVGRPWEEAVIIEVHVGVLGSFAGVAAQLEGWRDLGITAVELMPVGAFGGTRNWGYDGVLPYAVAQDYGTPDDLRALVDQAHALGMMVFLDVVYNHFGPDGNYLGAYAGDFFDTRAQTPWGGKIAVEQPAVRRYFIDNALMWLGDYRIDGLRFDAVHAIDDPGFLDEMAGEIREALPGRAIHLVLENEHNDPGRLLPGGYDAQWNDDFHNVLHVLLTGESDAYYADFAQDPTAKLATCLAEGFIYQGQKSGNLNGQSRGGPSDHLPASAFVTFLQNHDQIGNRALGERLTCLADPAKLRAATALLLLCPQIPLLFMGDPEGSHSPFLFFTDFHDDLADAVREGRRREFAKFPAFADPQVRKTIPDPNALATFEASRPVGGPEARHWRSLYRELLALRHAAIVPHLKGATGLDAQVLGDGAVAARWRLADDSRLMLAINLGDAAVAFPDPDGGAPPLFALGKAGAPASFCAWCVR